MSKQEDFKMVEISQETIRAWLDFTIPGVDEPLPDEFEIQEKAVELGLLKVVHPTKPCGTDGSCVCEDYYDLEDFEAGEVDCHRKNW